MNWVSVSSWVCTADACSIAPADSGALGAELAYLVGRDMQLGLGYNILGFRDDELTIDEYSRRGAYLRLRYKFDEDLLLRGPRSEQRLANSPAGHGIDANALNNTPAHRQRRFAPGWPSLQLMARACRLRRATFRWACRRAIRPLRLDVLPAGDDIVQDEVTCRPCNRKEINPAEYLQRVFGP